MISQYLDLFAPSDSRFSKYCPKPYINGNIIYSAFRWCINLNFIKWPLCLLLCSRVSWRTLEQEQVYMLQCLKYLSYYWYCCSTHFSWKPAVCKNRVCCDWSPRCTLWRSRSWIGWVYRCDTHITGWLICSMTLQMGAVCGAIVGQPSGATKETHSAAARKDPEPWTVYQLICHQRERAIVDKSMLVVLIYHIITARNNDGMRIEQHATNHLTNSNKWISLIGF